MRATQQRRAFSCHSAAQHRLSREVEEETTRKDRPSQDRIRTSRGQRSDIWRSGISICKRRARSLAPVPHEHLARQVACQDLVLPGKAGRNITNGNHPFEEQRGMASTQGLFSMVGSTENERMQQTGQTQRPVLVMDNRARRCKQRRILNCAPRKRLTKRRRSLSV